MCSELGDVPDKGEEKGASDTKAEGKTSVRDRPEERRGMGSL